jgi:thiol-disulfide isomerase/thioredoxin
MIIRSLTLSLFFLTLLIVPWCQASSEAQQREFPWSGGDEISTAVYPGAGKQLLLMLPSERGVSPRQAPLAEGLARRGVETWVVDLHGTLFLPPGTGSLRDVPADMVAELLQHAVATEKRVYLMATGRSAALALEAARQWQLGHPRQAGLGGVILFHPDLYRLTPQGGTEPEFLPVTESTNLPIYFFQPMNASARWHLVELVTRLQKSGSDVLVQRLQGVGNGFHLRPDYSDLEKETSARLPSLIQQAMRLLEPYGRPREAIRPSMGGEAGAGGATVGAGAELRPFAGRPAAPPLRLKDLGGIEQDLENYRGEVVLVNFWATWCPPCVEEIPSLQRLSDRLAGKRFRVLAVDVGEDAATVRAFMSRFEVDFPVLMDPDGTAVRQWHVYAFPTSFLIDRSGMVRYSLFGALEWDAPEVVARIEELLRSQ